jgi:hypothetical protein
VFKSGYENDTYIARSTHRIWDSLGLLGVDNTTGYNWTESDQGLIPYLTDFYFYNEGGSNQIIDGGFLGRHGKILKMEIEPGAKRAESEMFFDHPNLDSRKIYNPENPNLMLDFTIKHKLYLHSDYNKLKNYPGTIYWWQIFEYKNWPWSTHFWRGNVDIWKDSGSDQLYWMFTTEYVDFDAPTNSEMWNWEIYFKDGTVQKGWGNGVTNKAIPVPIGEWFDLEIYFKEGYQDTGRFVMQVNNEDVFDLEIATRDPIPDRTSGYMTPVRNIFPHKHYISPTLTSFMEGNSIYYYDDFEFWEGNALSVEAPSGTITPTPTPTLSPGDGNGDGVVDGKDFIIWLSHYGENVSGVNNGDYNDNGAVEIGDYVVWINNY